MSSAHEYPYPVDIDPVATQAVGNLVAAVDRIHCVVAAMAASSPSRLPPLT